MSHRILFITYVHLGDAILNTSILQHFIKKYPQSKITVIGGKSALPIYESYNNVVETIPIIKRKYGMHWLELWFKNLFARWDIVVDCRHSFISLFLFAGKRYYKMSKYVKKTHHFSDRMRYFLNCKNIHYPHVHIHDRYFDKLHTILQDYKNKKFITVAPTTNWLPKTWPIDNFILLLKKIKHNPRFSNIKFLITAAPNEFECCVPLLNALGDDAISIIHEKIMITAAALKTSKMFIGNDSGLMHLASATNTPILALFGATPVNIYSPFVKNKNLIIKAPSYCSEQQDTLLKRKKNFSRNLMASLKVADVYDKFCSFYRN